MARVLISAGHTVMDPGAIYQDLREADLTRNIARRLIPYLEKAGVETKGVPLDLSLFQRIEWINNTGYSDSAGDICLEVHINDGGKRGIEGWYRGQGDSNSWRLTKTVVETVTQETGYPSLGAKSEFEHELGQLTFLNRSNPATTILETLFIDNEEDNKLLRDSVKLEELSQAIAKGILRYLGKDLEGKELPADQKPKYDNVPAPVTTSPGTSTPTGLTFQPATPAVQAAPAPAGPSTAFAPTQAFPSPAFPSTGAGFGAGAGGGAFMADREQRKEMIKKTYIKVLGREPNQNDLNYFLNQGTAEAELTRKMIDSQEHADLLKAKQELSDLKQKFADKEREALRLRATANDQKQMLENLNRLLQHKNQALAALEQAFQGKFGAPSNVIAAQRSGGLQTTNSPHKVKIPKRLGERFFAFLSKHLA